MNRESFSHCKNGTGMIYLINQIIMKKDYPVKLMRNIIRFVLVLFCFFQFLCEGIVCEENEYVDVHIHLDPMALQKEGFSFTKRSNNPRKSNEEKIDYKDLGKNIISIMDKMGVERAMLMPPPQVPSQQGIKYTYATCLSVIKYYPDRLLLGGGGDNLNPLIYQYGREEITQEIRAQFRKEAEKLVKAGIKVFGEMAALHLSMQEHHIFSQVDPDHPLFLLLADIAAEHNIPIDLHMEAVPEDILMPEAILKISSRNPKKLKANISGLENLLKHNRKAKIVWQHIGWDNIGFMTIERLTGLLKKHSNLYLAIRVEYRQMQMDKSGKMANRIVDDNWKIYPEWVKFMTDFSDRIVVGSDDFMGMIKQQARPKDSFKETWRIMEQLPEEIARKIGRSNAVRIYNLHDKIAGPFNYSSQFVELNTK
ncbi:MAG: hypothetical protein A2Y62_20460 [Candidatus Fischerbacteria bacterium RBG_13_37_8]|uniref:Amidohydrolase-related domain-containing protein n=1 Tax=Candidatus Fischerbacteria bacterium RBG_13_37_8 TaxID=1817863 RepID=A0A1F5VXG7_9BACT|nr:MAG: hypothetical protein A2Y62_20460 [Candidatus Fischerbacteria bacterium RBG_13_37_8]